MKEQDIFVGALNRGTSSSSNKAYVGMLCDKKAQ